MKALAFVAMLCATTVLPAERARGQESACGHLKGAIGMVQAKSLAALERARAGVRDDYRAQTVYAVRKFELTATAASATALLDIIPQNDKQQLIWMTFGDSLCDQESLKEMAELSRFGDRLQKELSRAVIMVPARMSQYVYYSRLATRDPHSRYALEMKAVCRWRRSDLKAGVIALAPNLRGWFEDHVFDAERCLPRSFPESE